MTSIFGKLLILPPVALGVGAIMLASAQRAAPERAEAAEQATVARYIEAQPRPVTPRVLGYGVVEPARTWTAAPQVDGRVAYVSENFVKGGQVAKDEVLIRIAQQEYELAVAQAEANIASAEAQIEEKRADIEAKKRSLEIEKRSLDIARRELDRQEQLVERGAGASATVDSQERTVLQQESAVQNLENELDLAPSQLKALEQNLEVEKARLANARLDLERTEITAPFPGRVAEANVEVSQYVSVGSDLGAVDGAEEAEIEAQIAPAKMRDFARIVIKGQAGAMTLPSQIARRVEAARESRGLRARIGFDLSAGGVDETPARWDGRVERVSDTVDPETRAIGLIVSVDDPYAFRDGDEARPPLIKGLFVEVELLADPVEGLTPVPRAALEKGEVLVADGDNRLARRAVELAANLGDMALIRSGLEPGDRVVISSISPAIEGMLLKPVHDEEAEARLARSAAGEGDAR